jgi:hypothetical protein
MDVIGFLFVPLGSSTVQLQESLGSRHAHVQKLISVIKMATALKEIATEKQRSVVRFSVGKRTQCKAYS